MPRGLPRRPLVFGLTTGLVVLCGAVPAPDDGDLTVGAGGGYQRRVLGGGCAGGPTYAYELPEATVELVGRKRLSRHFVAEVRGSASVAWVRRLTLVEPGGTDEGPLAEEGDRIPAIFFVPRFGGDWTHGGFMLGIGGIGAPLLVGEAPSGILSASAWLGRRDRVSGWGEILPSPMTNASGHRILFAGLGHAGERAELELGYGGYSGVVRAAVRVAPGTKVGLWGSSTIDEPRQPERMFGARLSWSPGWMPPVDRAPRRLRDGPPTIDDMPDAETLPD